jgi:VanZ family protein
VKGAIQAFLPLVLWSAVVVFVGGLEDVQVPKLPRHTDKLAHFLMYGVGGGLAAFAGHVRGRGAGWAGLLFVLLVGAVDELRQTTLATRQGDVLDWVADAAGAITFYFLVAMILRRR